MTRDQIKKDIEEYMVLNNFDNGSYLLGVKHGFDSVTIENVSLSLVRQIANAAFDYILMCRESGINKEDIHLLCYNDILRIAQRKNKQV